MKTLRIVVLGLITIAIGVITNWFYDILESAGVLPKNPTPIRVIFVALLLIPMFILLNKFQQPTSAPAERKESKSGLNSLIQAIGKVTIGYIVGFLWWLLFIARWAAVVAQSEPQQSSLVFQLGLFCGSFASLFAGIVGGITGAFRPHWFFLFGRIAEEIATPIDQFFSKVLSNPFPERMSEIIGGVIFGTLYVSFLGLAFGIIAGIIWGAHGSRFSRKYL